MNPANTLPTAGTAPPIAVVVSIHAEEAGFLAAGRDSIVNAPHIAIRHLERYDNRLAAQLDGVRVAGAAGWDKCRERAGGDEAGGAFPACVMALASRLSARIEPLLALAETVPEHRASIVAAFGWTSADHLRGTVSELLVSASSFRRWLGIAACAVHRADPGDALPRALADPDPACRFWAAWSAVLLGDRRAALEALGQHAQQAGPERLRAMRAALATLELPAAPAILQSQAHDPAVPRTLIQGAGIAGDAIYVPWLIKQMDDPMSARIAGESFTFITGADLARFDLDRRSPEDFAAGPSDDPADAAVSVDADEDLAWPDPARIVAWWQANQHRFSSGVRSFMGAPVTRAHCHDVLRHGFQRQRIAAAINLALLAPGEPLFEWRAPVWRQQRRLARLN